MPSLNRYEKVTCENCGTQTTKLNLERHKKRCYAGTLYCTQYPSFSTKSQSDMNYHIAKKPRAPKPDVTFKCKLCYQKFPGFYALRQHRNTRHGMQIGSATTDVDVELIVGDVEDQSLREEFVLVNISWWIPNSKGRDTKYSITQWKLSTKTSWTRNWIIFFNNLKCAAKVNVALGFFLKNIEDGGFRCFYAHENTTLLDRSKLVCIHDDLAKLKDFLIKTDVTESCSREESTQCGGSTSWQTWPLLHFFSQRYSYGVQRRSLTQTTFGEMHNQLSHVWRKSKTTM